MTDSSEKPREYCPHDITLGTCVQCYDRLREALKDVPSKQEIEVTLKTINDIATFVAMRGLWTEQVPELVRVTTWLKALVGE